MKRRNFLATGLGLVTAWFTGITATKGEGVTQTISNGEYEIRCVATSLIAYSLVEYDRNSRKIKSIRFFDEHSQEVIPEKIDFISVEPEWTVI